MSNVKKIQTSVLVYNRCDFLQKGLLYIFKYHNCTFRQTSKAAALVQAQQQHHQAQQQAQQQKQQAVMSALSQQLTAVDTQPDISNELQIVDENGDPVNWQDDPNELRYCLCNQVSYGEMVGCDNDDVSIHAFLLYLGLIVSTIVTQGSRE